MSAQKALQSELSQNIELTEKARELNSKEIDQKGVLETSTVELNDISKKLKTYEETTRIKDDASKFTKAVANV